MRLAGWTYSYDKMPIEESVAHMASVGYDGLELATGDAFSTPIESLDRARVDQIKSLLDHHKLTAVAVSALWGIVTETDVEWDAHLDRWRGSIDVAAQLGAPFIACGSSSAPAGMAREQVWTLLHERMHRIVDHAAERGITVTLEPHWGAVVETPGDALELIAAVGLPNFKVNCDVCHPFALGYDLESIAAILGPHTVYAHVCDVRGRHQGGPPPAGHQLVNPGEGEIDWPRWLRLLHDAGHHGWIATQISVMRRAWPDYDPKQCMEDVYRVLTDAMEKGGVPRLRS